MKRDVYVEVVAEIKSCEFDFRTCVKRLVERFPDEAEEVLRSVAAAEYQKRVMHACQSLNSPGRKRALYEEYRSRVGDSGRKPPSGADSVICDMAKEIRYSPVLLSKIILEQFMKSAAGETGSYELSGLLRNPFMIPDPTLASEVYLCRLRDDQYGSHSDAVKHCLGLEYEEKLKSRCRELGLSFKDEDALRATGYDKTPDVFLEVPIAVNGCAVNWIESKALFGDDEAHTTYLRKQLSCYWNRYGPGLVIYWFGYIDDLAKTKKYPGIMLSDRFPEEFVRFNPELGRAVSDEDWGIDPSLEDGFELADKMGTLNLKKETTAAAN